MTAVINGIIVTGTPQEIAELLGIQNTVITGLPTTCTYTLGDFPTTATICQSPQYQANKRAEKESYRQRINK